jgi:chaperone BCS1
VQPVLPSRFWAYGKVFASHANLITKIFVQGIGVGLTVLRQGLVFGATALRRRMLVTLEINNKDRAYDWFLAWMSYQNKLQQNARIPWVRSHQLSVETVVEQRKNGSSSALFNLVAGPGTHYFQYRGAWMQVGKFWNMLYLS